MQANTHERSSRFEIENDAKSLRTAQMAAQDKALTLNRELEAVRNVNDRLRKNVATVRDEMTNKELMWAEEKEDLLKEVKEAQVQVAKVSQMEEKISEQHAAIQFMEQELQKAELCESEAQAALDRNKKLLVAGEERMQELVLLFGAAKELYSEIQSMGAQHHFLSALRPVGVQGLPNSAIQRSACADSVSVFHGVRLGEKVEGQSALWINFAFWGFEIFLSSGVALHRVAESRVGVSRSLGAALRGPVSFSFTFSRVCAHRAQQESAAPDGIDGGLQRFEVNGVPLNKQLRKLPLLKVGLDRPSHPL
ncbi:hypothetical protein CYMTET_30048 [Cymbomonas tetramitiformis]|uniref:Uncharacterized protein n=1 Tax=Cymbomonas tetramitiformis TaxID=36881 RepID=A0AAE0FK87_9CHLO|nr:hypothetical protein CYMTET_30048 [Cymbomonas tetramitiformis]